MIDVNVIGIPELIRILKTFIMNEDKRRQEKHEALMRTNYKS